SHRPWRDGARPLINASCGNDFGFCPMLLACGQGPGVSLSAADCEERATQARRWHQKRAAWSGFEWRRVALTTSRERSFQPHSKTSLCQPVQDAMRPNPFDSDHPPDELWWERELHRNEK